MDSKKVGSLISKCRKDLGYTQTELAQKLNVSNRTVSKWENGDGYPDITILPEIAKVLNITVDELLSGEKQEIKTEEKSEKIKADDGKIFFILSVFLGIAGALLGVITEIYSTWAFSILFYTHWEIIFDVLSLFCIVASVLAFVLGLYKLQGEISFKIFCDFAKRNIKKFLMFFALWFSFPFAFLVRIAYSFNVNIETIYGNTGFYFLLLGSLIYIIANIVVYRKYR